MAKTSFLGSVMAGLGGAVKGAIALGVIGAVVGAAIGTGVGLLGIGGATLATGLVGGTAIGASLAGIGTTIGAITGVIQSREQDAPSAEDIVNVAKISFAQGAAVGANQKALEASMGQSANAGKSFQERLAAENRAMGARQV